MISWAGGQEGGKNIPEAKGDVQEDDAPFSDLEQRAGCKHAVSPEATKSKRTFLFSHRRATRPRVKPTRQGSIYVINDVLQRDFLPPKNPDEIYPELAPP